MQTLTDHEKKILELVKKHPEILDNPAEREKIAKANSMTEKTLRNRIADLKRYGLVGDNVTTDDSQKVSPREYPSLLDYIAVILRWKRTIFLLVSLLVQ
jgi:DNA-binding Lrp family transcriptional regulator